MENKKLLKIIFTELEYKIKNKSVQQVCKKPNNSFYNLKCQFIKRFDLNMRIYFYQFLQKLYIVFYFFVINSADIIVTTFR